MIEQNLTLHRGDTATKSFVIYGNYTTYTLTFTVKNSNAIYSARLMQKVSTSATEITATYANGYTTINVFILRGDSAYLRDGLYYYDIEAVSGNTTVTLFGGYLNLIADTTTPYDGYYLPVQTDQGTNDGDILVWNNTSKKWEAKTRAEGRGFYEVFFNFYLTSGNDIFLHYSYNECSTVDVQGTYISEGFYQFNLANETITPAIIQAAYKNICINPGIDNEIAYYGYIEPDDVLNGVFYVTTYDNAGLPTNIGTNQNVMVHLVLPIAN